MIKTVLSLSFAILFCTMLQAQNVKKTTFSVDENSIVKDSTGRRITKLEFYDAVVSGNYKFKPVKDKAGNIIEYLLVRSDSKDNTKINFTASSTAPSSGGITVGQLAPEFSGRDMNDTATYDFNQYKGHKIVVLNFWFATCAPCITELPDLNRLYDRYKDRSDIVFIAPTFETKENVQTFLAAHPFHYPVLPDAMDAVRAYRAISFPLNIIIDKEGKVAYTSAGGLPGIEYLLDKKIKDLLAITNDNKPVEEKPSTKPSAVPVNKGAAVPYGTEIKPSSSQRHTESSPAGGTLISSHPVAPAKVDSAAHK